MTNANVQSAVQNTLQGAVNPSAVTTTGPYRMLDTASPEVAELVKDENLAKKDLKVAYKAIFDAYDIQWKKGGIEDTQTLLKGLQGKVGEHVYAIAKTAMEHCKGYSLSVTRLYFHALCSKAEEALKSKHIEEKNEEKPIGQLIPLWSVYKTSIAKGLEKGIDPAMRNEESNALVYPTASLYRAAVQEIEAKERQTGSQAGNGRNSDKQTSSAFQLVAKGWAPRVSAAMDVLCQSLNSLTHEEQDKFAPQILALGNEVAEFVKDRQRAYADASSPENQRTAGEDMDVGTKAAMQKALDDSKGDTSKAAGKGKRNVRAA
jgi:hypothetical protein